MTQSIKGGFLRDDTTGALVIKDPTAPGLDALGYAKDLPPQISSGGAARRLQIRNDHRNPRAIALNGWSKTDPVGATGSTLTTVTDTDMGSCAEVSFTHDGSASRFVVLTLNDTSATYGIPVQKEQIIFTRARVKNTVKPGGAGDIQIDIFPTFKTAALAAAGSKTVNTLKRFATTATTLVEGFDFTPNTAVWVQEQIQFSLPAVAGVYTFRVGRPVVVVDPQNEVPDVVVDGTQWYCNWVGTADASPTEGFTGTTPNPTTWYTGFNDNTFNASNAPLVLSAAEDVALMQEGGYNIYRFGIEIPAMSIAWPSAGSAINWRNTAYAPMLDALQAAGLKACPIGGVPATWMTTGATGLLKDVPTSEYPHLIQVWKALVATWPDVIVAIEWWNEPNLNAGSWGATPDAAKYTDTLKAFYGGYNGETGFKSVYPNVKVLGGAMSRYVGTDAGGTDTVTYLNAMYTAGAAVGVSHDNISVHPYPTEPTSGLPTGAHTGGNTGHDEIIQGVREAKRTAGDTSKIWSTEVGANTTSTVWNEASQAQTLLLIRGQYKRAGDIEACIFHTLTSDSTQSPTIRGWEFIEYQTLRRKPVWEAMRSGQIPGGQWRYLTLQNSWVPFNTTASGWDARPRYRIDPFTKEVEVRGAIKSGATATSVIATLPPGYRPSEIIDVGSTQSSAAVANISAGATNPALVRIGADGNVFPVANTSTTYLAFYAKFRAER